MKTLPLSRLALLFAGGALVYLSGCTAWRIGQSADLARRSEPFQHRPAEAKLRLLVVGDSTAVGTGATNGKSSLAGLLAQRYPQLHIENRARDGATFADVVDQLQAQDRFDLVLIQAGGNDVIRLRDLDSVRGDVERVVAVAAQRAEVVIIMPAGNVGNAPFFFPPASWLMTRRSRELHGHVRDVAARTGAAYVNLFQERENDPFVIDPALNARDGLHPSDAGYVVWFNQLMAQAGLDARLAAARARP